MQKQKLGMSMFANKEDYLNARIEELLGDLKAKEELEEKLFSKIDVREDMIRHYAKALKDIISIEESRNRGDAETATVAREALGYA